MSLVRPADDGGQEEGSTSVAVALSLILSVIFALFARSLHCALTPGAADVVDISHRSTFPSSKPLLSESPFPQSRISKRTDSRLALH